MSQWSEQGACWYCSYQYATKTYNNWIDGNGNYCYYNTCRCSIMMGCGAFGYVKNEYCPMCHATYPTVAVSYKLTRWGYMTLTKRCSQCSYYYHVEGWT